MYRKFYDNFASTNADNETFCTVLLTSQVPWFWNRVNNHTQVNRMFRSRRVLAIGGKHCDYGWTGSVVIHFYVL